MDLYPNLKVKIIISERSHVDIARIIIPMGTRLSVAAFLIQILCEKDPSVICNFFMEVMY